MGPAWGRELGMIADTECRIFDDFPTDVDGGWQWEDILQHAGASTYRRVCMR